jgi:hypothetical protein
VCRAASTACARVLTPELATSARVDPKGLSRWKRASETDPTYVRTSARA